MASTEKLMVASAEAELRRDFSALTNGCGVYGLESKAWISITGEDRVRWLNGMVTNNVRDLKPGTGVYAFLLSPQGRIQGDLHAFNFGDRIVAQTDRAQVPKLLEIFDKYIIMDDVEVSEAGEAAALAVAGPKAREVLQGLGLDVEALEALQFARFSRCEKDVMVVRGDNALVEVYELWVKPEDVEGLREALGSGGALAVGAEAVELLRIASGIPTYGKDIRERDLPQETEQARALHFSKGCYVGQEIVERIRSRGQVHRKFTGFEVRGPLPAVDSKIQHDGKDVGEITSTATLPGGNGRSGLALGYIRREVGLPRREFQVGESVLTVAGLPFSGVSV